MRLVLAGLLVLPGLVAGILAPQSPARETDPQTVFDEAIDSFVRGDIDTAADQFDRLVRLVPELAPRLWQRGIVLYYAGRYEDCRAQFELHRTVNPNDVENAAWHFLCVARAESPERARAALLPVGPDPRVPMREVYALYEGTVEPEAVETAGRNRPEGEFYAHLYLGLHAEALGRDEAARVHLRAAAADEYARAGGFMHTVARVHLRLQETER